VLGLRPDAVIVATGAAMAPPPGLRDEARAARDIRAAAAALLTDPVAGGGLAVLLDLDATPATYDAAELLAARFRRVILLTPREGIARDSPLLVAQGIHRRLAALGVEILTCREAMALDGGRLVLRHVLTGAEEEVAGIDLLVYASARVPRDRLLEPLRAAGIPMRAVGDALAPRLLLSAVREGQAAGEAV
jgi:hypothetical protein